MPKKIIYVFAGIILFGGFHFALADVAINEIMYDLKGADIDWVEVKNSGTEDVDLSVLKLYINNSASNHAINNFAGSAVLHAGDYGVIVVSSYISGYTAKWGSTSNLFTSSYSLPNAGATVQINAGDKLSPVSSVSYSSAQGATEDNNSLQLVSGSWVPARPTPNAENQSTQSDDTSVNSTSSSSGSGPPVVAGISTKEVSNFKIKTEIKVNTVALVGVPTAFEGSATDHRGKSYLYGKYFWNFGDGDSRVSKPGDTEKFTHTYFYPGDYNVTLEFYEDFDSKVPDATDEFTIKVVPAAILISRVGDSKDFFVELTNNSAYDTDISGWALVSGQKTFVLPKNTFLQAKNKLTLSPRITGFDYFDKSSLKLMTSSWEVVYDYSASNWHKTYPISVSASTASSTQSATVPSPEDSISPEDLSAAAAQSEPAGSSSWLWISGFILLLGISSVAVWSVRRRPSGFSSSTEADEFEMLDE